jgi:hypothetical protein
MKGTASLAVDIILNLLGLELALTGAGLCAVWPRRRPWPPLAAALAAVCVPAFHLIAMSALIPFWPEIGLGDRAMLIGLTVTIILIWSGFANSWSKGSPRDADFWGLAAVAAQLLVAAISVWNVAHWFVLRDGFHPMPRPVMAGLIGMNLLMGAVLLGAAISGVLAGRRPLAQLEQAVNEAGENPKAIFVDAAGQLTAASRLLVWALLLRALAIGFTLVLNANYNPYGPRYFYIRLFTIGGDWILLRVLLGLVLPMCYAWLIMSSIKELNHRMASSYFLPAAILVLLGEILGAGLTTGLSGIAF